MKKFILTPEDLELISKARKKIGFQFTFWEDIVERMVPSESMDVTISTDGFFNDLVTSMTLYKGKLKKQKKIDRVLRFIEKLQSITEESVDQLDTEAGEETGDESHVNQDGLLTQLPTFQGGIPSQVFLDERTSSFFQSGNKK